MAQSGRLSPVAIRKVASSKIKAALNSPIEFFFLNARKINTIAGNRKPIAASASRFAYQVFRLVSALGEKRKFAR